MVYWLMNGMKWSEKAADIKTQTKQHKTTKNPTTLKGPQKAR